MDIANTRLLHRITRTSPPPFINLHISCWAAIPIGLVLVTLAIYFALLTE